MVGIFDSGKGGEFTLRELRRIRPDADVAFLADRKNAPYGTKEKHELVRIVKRNIDILRNFGTENILVACCTASTVCSELSEEYRTGVIPIIDGTAYAAVKASKNMQIGVIATEATVRSHAFAESISRFCKRAEVRTCAAQELVAAIEWGGDTDSILDQALSELGDVDTVILGCTHFAAVEEKIKRKGFAAVNSARIGAMLLAERITRGGGATLYINE